MYMCVHMYENACRRAEEGGRFHETGTKDGCVGVGMGVWVFGPLQKQRELLTTDCHSP